MSVETISSSELNKLLSIYDVYKQERFEDESPFMALLALMEQRQTDQTIAERICRPGEIIVREHEAGDDFYIIRQGQTVVIKGDVQNPTILGFRSIGEAIGEMALLENLPVTLSCFLFAQ